MIQLLINYGGKRTNERRIPAGLYAHDDKRLFGLADYLVANGHAIVIEDVHEPTETIPQEATTESVPIEDAPQPTHRRRSTKRKASN